MTNTVVIDDWAQTITNKTISLTDNTLSGTKLEFDAALSDDEFVYLWQANTFTSTEDQVLSGGLRLGLTTNDTAWNIRWDWTNFQWYNGTEWNNLDDSWGGFPQTVYSADLTMSHGSAYSITHNIWTTENEVEKGRYILVLAWDDWTDGYQTSWLGSAKYTASSQNPWSSRWLSWTATSADLVRWQTNTLSFYNYWAKNPWRVMIWQLW